MASPRCSFSSKTITNLGLVRDVQSQIDGAESSWSDGCNAFRPTYYVYQFRFATGSVTTQEYEGNSVLWGVVYDNIGIHQPAQSCR